MDDKNTNPYYLRNVDLDKLDFSSYGKGYSSQELDDVKTSLRELQKQHHAEYEALPLIDKAQIYATEKFGDYQKYAEQNPEIAYGVPAAVVGGAAIVGAQKLFGSLRDKISSLTNSNAAPLPDDSILAKQMPDKPVVSAAPSTPAPVSQETPPAAVKGIDKTPDQIRREKLAQAQAQLDGRAIAPTAPAPTPSAQTMTPEQMVQADKPASIPQGMTAETEVGKAPKDMGLVEAGDTNRELKAAEKQASAAEKELAKQGAVTPTSKTKKPAVPIFKTASDIPPGMVFRPDVGNLDRGLVNILGPEGRLYAKEVLNEGKMFGHAGADYNQKLKGLVSNYAEELKKITPSIDLTTREGRIAVGAPHTENYGSALGKAAKVGGVLGTLMTIAQSANAREAAGNVAESLLPIGLTPSNLAPGTLYTPAQQREFSEQLAKQKASERQKLGSPYRSVPPPR